MCNEGERVSPYYLCQSPTPFIGNSSKGWSSASRAQRPLPMALARRQFLSSRDTTWRNNGSSTRSGSRIKHHIRISNGEYWLSRGEMENVIVIIVIKAGSEGVCCHNTGGRVPNKKFYRDVAVRSLGIPFSANRKPRLPRRPHWKAVRCRSTTHGYLCKLDSITIATGIPRFDCRNFTLYN